LALRSATFGARVPSVSAVLASVFRVKSILFPLEAVSAV
jgi:hypothetical protein